MIPRVLIAAPTSGSGKTMLTCGLLQWLQDHDFSPRSFKCGPDFIDPLFHRTVLGIEGRNLDAFFSEEDRIRRNLQHASGGTAVIEGVMGLYDGILGTDGKASSYEIASITRTPIVLVVNCAKPAEDSSGERLGAVERRTEKDLDRNRELAEVLRRLLEKDVRHLVRGIVCNRVPEKEMAEVCSTAKRLLQEMNRTRNEKIRLLGMIPYLPELVIESRHLGLKLPGEIEDLRGRIARMAREIDERMDMQALTALMESAVPFPGNEEKATVPLYTAVPEMAEPLTLAVARDEAFCFYYADNLESFEARGIRIREFSPLRDYELPVCDGLLLGGGYPELYAEELSRNESIRGAVRSALLSGLPSLAECGGFLYLQRDIERSDKTKYPMVGLLTGRAVNTGRLGRFGYISVEGSGLLEGLTIRGHEFHYYDTDDNGSDAVARKPGNGKTWSCMHLGKDHAWGFPHLYYPSCPSFVDRFCAQMQIYRERTHSERL